MRGGKKRDISPTRLMSGKCWAPLSLLQVQCTSRMFQVGWTAPRPDEASDVQLSEKSQQLPRSPPTVDHQVCSDTAHLSLPLAFSQNWKPHFFTFCIYTIYSVQD